MNKVEIQKYIKENKEILPLSYFDLKFNIKGVKPKSKYKIEKSEKYLTDNFPIYKFYKPITRF